MTIQKKVMNQAEVIGNEFTHQCLHEKTHESLDSQGFEISSSFRADTMYIPKVTRAEPDQLS